jgi:signal transduction histidine kinase
MNQGTARKTHPRSLRHSQRLAASIASLGDEHVIELDSHGVCVNVWATRGGTELSARIRGRKISDVVGEEIFRSIQPVFQRVMETEQSEAFEHAFPDGSRERWFRFRLVPVFHSGGSTKSLIIQASDVTVWKQERDALRRKSDTIRALVQAGRSATADTDITTVLDEFVFYAMRVTGAQSGGAGLNLPGICSYFHHYDDISGKRHDYAWPLGTGIEGWLQKHVQPYLSNLPGSDALVPPAWLTDFDMRSVLFAPVVDGGRSVIGTIAVINKTDAGGFSPEDAENVTGLAQVASVHLQNCVAFRKIERAEHQLHQLSSRLLRAQDDERRHIAKNMHDLNGENLTALLMSLRRLRHLTPEKDQQRMPLVEDCFSLVEKITDQMRTLSYVLYPPLLDEAGLAAVVPWYTSGFAERSGIRVELDMPDDFGRMQTDVEVIMFRTLQECLINVHRHARCTATKISLARDGPWAVLEVADNGRGMPEHFRLQATNGHAPLGVGIAGMRERVEQLNGHIEIESAPGGGTTIRISLPADGLPGSRAAKTSLGSR